MNKKLTQWYENLTLEQKREIDIKASDVVSCSYTVQGESGDCQPDPDDTVRIYTESERVTLTEKEAEYCAQKVKNEFR